MRAALNDIWPNYQTTDQQPLWFAFTPDLQRCVVGGVKTQAELVAIIDAGDALAEHIDFHALI